MIMKKKVSFALLSVLMCASLASCGDEYKQSTGLRFENVKIPAAAQIDAAYLNTKSELTTGRDTCIILKPDSIEEVERR
jgi:hypothetical protein